MNKEIERKYAIKTLPDDIKISGIKDIEQAFIYKDNNTHIRIRKVTNRKEQSTNYIYTIKTKGDIQYKDNSSVGQKYEIENLISKEEYKELLTRKISKIINKTRINVPIENDLVVEIDIYYDYLDGMLTAEIEFPNEEIAEQFDKPDWLGEELGYKEWSNGRLSQMDKEQFRMKVTEEFIEKNKSIIKRLKKLIE